MTKVHNGLYYADHEGERARLKEFQEQARIRAALYAEQIADPSALHKRILERLNDKRTQRMLLHPPRFS